MKESELIIEGRLISSKSFKIMHHGIYTANTYKVLKVFKGAIVDSLIEVVYEGGQVDGYETIITDGVSDVITEGVFFFKDKCQYHYSKDLESYFPPVYGIGYYSADNKVRCGDVTFDNIEKEIYQPIEALTGHKYIEVHPNNCKSSQQKK